jgi:hypothetical protein
LAVLRALLVVTVLLAGCGGSGPDPRAAEPLDRYLQSLAADDYASACAQLAPAAQRDFTGFLGTVVPSRSAPHTCVAAFRTLVAFGSLDVGRRAVMDRDLAQRPDGRGYDVEALEDDRARVVGSTKSVPVERVSGGSWRIARLDFSDVR